MKDMINKDALNGLTGMINKMDKALDFYRSGAKVAKDLYVELPLILKNKIAGLVALRNICEKVEYYYTLKDDSRFSDWIVANDKPTQDEINIAIDLLNQYRQLKYNVSHVEYFIPDELCRK